MRTPNEARSQHATYLNFPGLICDTVAQKNIWVHPAFICSIYSSNVKCLNNEHKTNCSDYTGGRRCRYAGNQYRYIKPFQMCHPSTGKDLLDFAVCDDGRDQLNCSDVALSCLVSGYLTTVSRWGICRKHNLCDDNFDDLCYHVEHDCNIHKHQICDGKQDCSRHLDEVKNVCKEVTTESCVRKANFNQNESLPIPKKWLCDGVNDCVDGSDEDRTLWKICGSNETKLRCKEKDEVCSELFKCPNSVKKFAELAALCNYIEDCKGEKLICAQSRKLAYVYDTAVAYKSQTILSVSCLPGIKRDSICNTAPYTTSTQRMLGVIPLNITYESKKISCKYFFGEVYVLKACSGLCHDANCPLRQLDYSSCPNLKNRAITLVGGLNETHNLTVVQRIQKLKGYSDRLFECDNGNCIPHHKVCNLANDCGDTSDERNCVNNFKCNSSDYFIALSAVCDGRMDCNDSSDECNEHCTCTIIESNILMITAWIFGVTAVFINLTLIIRKSVALKDIRSKASLYNSLFVISISVGDMCVGLYLLVVSVANAVFSNSFCANRYTWLNSATCVVLGVISSFGSLLSLFTMTLLSLYRCYSLKNIFASRSLNRMAIVSIALSLAGLLFSALLISVIPILPHHEDYFLNGIYYLENPLFVDAPSKTRHIKILEAYYGRLTNRLLNWRIIRELIAGMFTRDMHGVYGSNKSFYGNAGVCMFKYFVRHTDPQHVFSLVVLTLNTLLCLLIALSYGAIYLLSRGGISKDRQSHVLERKISLIILTDFLSWIPFTFLCLLHYLELYDGTPHYEVFSLLIIPINSVINPLIYDDIVLFVITAAYRRVKSHFWIRSKQGVALSSTQGSPTTRTQCLHMKAISSPENLGLSPTQVSSI